MAPSERVRVVCNRRVQGRYEIEPTFRSLFCDARLRHYRVAMVFRFSFFFSIAVMRPCKMSGAWQRGAELGESSADTAPVLGRSCCCWRLSAFLGQ